MYSWAIISDPFRTSLYILARNSQEFNSRYKKEVLSLLIDTLGFNQSYHTHVKLFELSN